MTRIPHARIRVWPIYEDMEPAIRRGELRLLAEALKAGGKGQIVPLFVQARVTATLDAMAR